MPKDPISSLDKIIQQVTPLVIKLLNEQLEKLKSYLISHHLSGAGPHSLAVRSRKLSSSIKVVRATVQGNKVAGGISIGTPYVRVHFGKLGSKVTIRARPGGALAIPLDAAKDSQGVALGGPRNLTGKVFIAKGVLFGSFGGGEPQPMFVLKKSVVIPRRIDPMVHLYPFIKPGLRAGLSRIVKGI